MKNNSIHPIKTDEALYLVGFCLRAGHEPTVYTLITSGGEIDRPVVKNNKVILFDRPGLAPSALELASNELKRLGPPPQEMDLVCDIPEMFHLVDTEIIDPTATILNCLNTFFDLLKAVKHSVPDGYKHTLYPFADHLTFHREYGTFLEKQHIDRAVLREAIDWLIETVFSKSKILSLQDWQKETKRKKGKTHRKTKIPKKQSQAKAEISV